MSEHPPKKRYKPVIEEIVPQSKASETVEKNVVDQKEESKKVDIGESSDTTESSSSILDNITPAIASPRLESKEKMRIGVGFFALMGMVAITVALISGAFYVYFNGVHVIKSPTEPQATPLATIVAVATPVSTPISSATPTATPVVNPASLRISVLNGSGKIGEAGKVKTLLESSGFKVAQTGNAASFNHKTTSIQVKSSVPADLAAKLKESLSKDYKIEDGQALDTKSSYDVIVTVGSN